MPKSTRRHFVLILRIDIKNTRGQRPENQPIFLERGQYETNDSNQRNVSDLIPMRRKQGSMAATVRELVEDEYLTPPCESTRRVYARRSAGWKLARG
jgi:hypothetical protein